MSSVIESADFPAPTRTSYVTWTWVLKRALLGAFIVAFVTGGMAWLIYASIDPSPDSSRVVKAGYATGTASVGTGIGLSITP